MESEDAAGGKARPLDAAAQSKRGQHLGQPQQEPGRNSHAFSICGTVQGQHLAADATCIAWLQSKLQLVSNAGVDTLGHDSGAAQWGKQQQQQPDLGVRPSR